MPLFAPLDPHGQIPQADQITETDRVTRTDRADRIDHRAGSLPRSPCGGLCGRGPGCRSGRLSRSGSGMRSRRLFDPWSGPFPGLIRSGVVR
ncbi:hypothetical protein OHS71_24895 [Streptomyces sp. NBC_00377]|uniref:hypothetical protein n=1 Tax=unclassified Streptomyces TaxID=2593676 RepID=UPI002E243043|nr:MULTISPECIES: hypothetical protein [unclassified Streptomyces]